LGPSVPFTEWMEGIEIGQEPRCLVEELQPWHALEESLSAEPGEDLIRLGLEPFNESEGGVALGHVDGPELAGPVIDAAEQVTMESAEMGQVVIAEVQVLMEQNNLSGCSEARFDLSEYVWVTDPEKVPQRSSARVDVGVVGHANGRKVRRSEPAG
jgi:hypothetical protein